jgi:hypothetical protein
MTSSLAPAIDELRAYNAEKSLYESKDDGDDSSASILSMIADHVQAIDNHVFSLAIDMKSLLSSLAEIHLAQVDMYKAVAGPQLDWLMKIAQSNRYIATVISEIAIQNNLIRQKKSLDPYLNAEKQSEMYGPNDKSGNQKDRRRSTPVNPFDVSSLNSKTEAGIGGFLGGAFGGVVTKLRTIFIEIVEGLGLLVVLFIGGLPDLVKKATAAKLEAGEFWSFVVDGILKNLGHIAVQIGEAVFYIGDQLTSAVSKYIFGDALGTKIADVILKIEHGLVASLVAGVDTFYKQAKALFAPDQDIEDKIEKQKQKIDALKVELAVAIGNHDKALTEDLEKQIADAQAEIARQQERAKNRKDMSRVDRIFDDVDEAVKTYVDNIKDWWNDQYIKNFRELLQNGIVKPYTDLNNYVLSGLDYCIDSIKEGLANAFSSDAISTMVQGVVAQWLKLFNRLGSAISGYADSIWAGFKKAIGIEETPAVPPVEPHAEMRGPPEPVPPPAKSGDDTSMTPAEKSRLEAFIAPALDRKTSIVDRLRTDVTPPMSIANALGSSQLAPTTGAIAMGRTAAMQTEAAQAASGGSTGPGAVVVNAPSSVKNSSTTMMFLAPDPHPNHDIVRRTGDFQPYR